MKLFPSSYVGVGKSSSRVAHNHEIASSNLASATRYLLPFLPGVRWRMAVGGPRLSCAFFRLSGYSRGRSSTKPLAETEILLPERLLVRFPCRLPPGAPSDKLEAEFVHRHPPAFEHVDDVPLLAGGSLQKRRLLSIEPCIRLVQKVFDIGMRLQKLPKNDLQREDAPRDLASVVGGNIGHELPQVDSGLSHAVLPSGGEKRKSPSCDPP